MNNFIKYIAILILIPILSFSQDLNDNNDDNKNEKIEYVISPNPFHDKFNIKIDDDILIFIEVNLFIYDIKGSLVYNKKYIFGNPIELNLSSGVYIVKFDMNNKTHIKKIIKY